MTTLATAARAAVILPAAVILAAAWVTASAAAVPVFLLRRGERRYQL